MTHSIRETHVCASADRFERTLVVLLVHTFLLLQYYTLKINRPEDLKVQLMFILKSLKIAKKRFYRNNYSNLRFVWRGSESARSTN